MFINSFWDSKTYINQIQTDRNAKYISMNPYWDSLLKIQTMKKDIFVHVDKLIDNFQFQFVNVNQKYVSTYWTYGTAHKIFIWKRILRKISILVIFKDPEKTRQITVRRLLWKIDDKIINMHGSEIQGLLNEPIAFVSIKKAPKSKKKSIDAYFLVINQHIYFPQHSMIRYLTAHF